MKNALLVNLKLPDYVSLIALVLSWLAIVLLLKSLFFASLGVAVFALVADMMDGYLARKFGASSFGKYIDSFLDVVLYIIYPALYLFSLGFSDPVSVTVLALFISSGILRLARFTADGFLEEQNQRWYVGMPVFWNLLWLFVLTVLINLLHLQINIFILGIGLVTVSCLMISTIRFPKPGSYKILAPLLLLIAVISIFVDLKS